MKPQKWPFKPDHITNDGETVNVDDIQSLKFGSISDGYLSTLKKRQISLKQLTGVGIIPNAHLEGIQTMLSANLGIYTAILEFSPEGTPVRTDSKLMFYSMHEPCKILRNYTDEHLCLKCDQCHAKLFYGLMRCDVDAEIEKRIFNNPVISDYMKRGEFIKYHSGPERPYLEYDCPILGYRELVFPIFFEERVIAVSWMGELCLQSNLEKILEQQRRCFTNPSDEFVQCCPSEESRKELEEKVRVAHERWVKDTKHILNDDDYELFISTATKELKGLERTLHQQMSFERGRYIQKHADNLIKEFREKLSGSDLSGEERWNFLWQKTRDIFRKMITYFDLSYTVVFASNRFEQKEVVLDVVVAEGDLPAPIKTAIDNHSLCFNLSKVPLEIRTQWKTSTEYPGLFSALDGLSIINKEQNIIRIFPVPFSPGALLAVLVGYKEGNPLETRLNSALQTFYAIILSTLSATLASIADETREKALGRLTHELKVPVVAVRGALEFMERTPGSKKFFDYDYIGDIFSWTDLMGQLIDKADATRYSNKDLQIQLKRVNILRDVTGPSIRQVGLLLKERGFNPGQITYNYKRSFDNFPQLWLDRKAFSQVMFNLLSNAIKYAYDDPEAFHIDIEGRWDAMGAEIFFRDSGPGIESDIKEFIFERGFRGKDAHLRDVAGQGLGLWIVRQIINAHGGTLELTNLKYPTEFTIRLPYSLVSQSF